jgi:enoyl-CoA hydratase/carnithine racemase
MTASLTSRVQNVCPCCLGRQTVAASRTYSFDKEREGLTGREFILIYDTIRHNLEEDGILVITLSRPKSLNAFTKEMCGELIDVFDRASDDDAVRAIVVTGEGRAFCAGMDLSGEGNVFGLDETLQPTMADMRLRLENPEICNGVRDLGGRLAIAMFDCVKPIVGAINGHAVGIGSTMLLPMDFRIASEHARFGFVFGRLGIIPDACSTWFLPRIVGHEQALEWFYTANIFDAQEALAKGLVRAIHPADTFLSEAKDFARQIVKNRSPVSVGLIRQMLNRNPAQSHPIEAHRVESLGMFYTSMADGREGVRAFTEKRPPRFNGRASVMPSFYPWDT